MKKDVYKNSLSPDFVKKHDLICSELVEIGADWIKGILKEGYVKELLYDLLKDTDAIETKNNSEKNHKDLLLHQIKIFCDDEKNVNIAIICVASGIVNSYIQKHTEALAFSFLKPEPAPV